MHSTPYNNLTLFNLTANNGEAATRGFGVFPSSETSPGSATEPASTSEARLRQLMQLSERLF
jgi:hypothetical protein